MGELVWQKPEKVKKDELFIYLDCREPCHDAEKEKGAFCH